MAKIEMDEDLLIDLLWEFSEFNDRFREFTKKVAKDLGWSRQRLEYHINKRKEE